MPKNRKLLCLLLLMCGWIGCEEEGCDIDIDLEGIPLQYICAAACEQALAVVFGVSQDDPSDDDDTPTSPGLGQAAPTGLTSLEFGFFGDANPDVADYTLNIDSRGVVADPNLTSRARLAVGENDEPRRPPRLYFTNGSGNQVVVFDTGDKRVTNTVAVGSEPAGIDITPDGKFLYVANQGGSSISVIDTGLLEVVDTIRIPGGGASLFDVAITPDGTTAYVTSLEDSGRVFVIDLASGSLTATIRVGRRPVRVAVSPDGTLAYVTSTGDGRVFIIDVLTNTLLRALAVTSAYGITFQPYGNAVFVTSASRVGKLTMINTASDEIMGEWPVGQFPLGVTTSRGGLHVYVTNRESDFITVIDPGRKDVVATIPVRAGLGPVTLIPGPIG